MSPPCVAAIFEGDNGGETATGVTGTEIRVAVPLRTSEPAATKAVIEALFAYANNRYELYGRRLRPVYVSSAVGNGAYTYTAPPPALRALAAEIGAQGAFAALPTMFELSNPHPAFFSELARQKLVTVARGAGEFLPDESLLDPAHPYLWSVYPSLEQRSAAVADLICTSLAGKPARFAGDPNYRITTRSFAVLAFGANGTPATGPLSRGLEACGVRPVASATYDKAPSQSSTDWDAILNRFKSAGATTLICLCDDYFNWFWSREANVGYRPEWLLPSLRGEGGMGGSDEWFPNSNMFSSPTRTPLFGLTEYPKLLPLQAMSWFRALVSTLPTADAKASALVAVRLYDQLAVLAAGIQGAGPALTPATFAQALMSMQFPNPGAGQSPFWQPSVGFGPGDHSFYNDYALVSWSTTLSALDPGATSPTGSWCYVDRGARFAPGQFPSDADARFFPADPSSCR